MSSKSSNEGFKAWTQLSAYIYAVRQLRSAGTVRSGGSSCRSEGYAERLNAVPFFKMSLDPISCWLVT